MIHHDNSHHVSHKNDHKNIVLAHLNTRLIVYTQHKLNIFIVEHTRTKNSTVLNNTMKLNGVQMIAYQIKDKMKHLLTKEFVNYF